MGIDVHALNFLRYARRFGRFENTLTIGRQVVHLRPHQIRHLLDIDDVSGMRGYCEAMLKTRFGASGVDSVDNSNFENATLVLDMNRALPATLASRYDTVFDGGCTEHIFNAPQALKNISSLCRPGGQILHVLPANNFCGHGFWQFSPELFFSLYSPANGYEQTEVFLADLAQTDKWFRVKQPAGGKRVNVHSATPLYLLVRTVLAREAFSHEEVQQSDYVYQWSHKDGRTANVGNQSVGKALRKIRDRFLGSILPRSSRLATRRWRASRSERLDRRNPGLSEISLQSIL
jgi:SAM-dependent methyltransferase